MTLNAPSAVDAIVWPGNVPGIRKLLVKLALMRARDASDMQREVDASTLADDLDVPPSLAGLGRFVRLSAIADVAKGPTGIKDARPGPYPLVVTAEDRGSCDHYDFEGEAVLIPTVSSTGHGDASLKRIHYQEGRFAVGSILAAVRVRDRALNSTRFLYEYLSVFKDELLVARMSGTANVSLTVKKIEGVPIPLIPIAQQQHLHDLLRLCDALEAQGRLEAEQHARLLGTLLGTLTDSSTPEELAANWQRVADHFDLLLDRPEAVDGLEQTILQLAVRGKLVPHISVELEQKTTEGLDAAVDDEPPFDIPNTWRWYRFSDVLDFQGGSQPPKSNFSESPRDGYVRLIQIRDLGDKPQPVFVAKNLVSKFCSTEDIMVGRYGASVGKVFWGIEGAYNVALVKIIDLHGSFDRRFLFLLLSSPLGQSWFRGISRSAQDGFNKNDIGPNWTPVPPLAEQAEIVARVIELRRLCADLRHRLERRSATQGALADSLIDEARTA